MGFDAYSRWGNGVGDKGYLWCAHCRKDIFCVLAVDRGMGFGPKDIFGVLMAGGGMGFGPKDIFGVLTVGGCM